MAKQPDYGMCALYARVSTKEQSADLQLPRLRQMAQQYGLTVYKEYVDDGVSGKDANRPAWQELMNEQKDGKFGTVFAVKLDRIMRSLVNLSKTMDELNDMRIRLVTGDIGEVDPKNPQSMLILRVMGAMAEWERDIIRTRTIDALSQKKAQGVKIGRPQVKMPIRYIAEDWSANVSIQEISRKYNIPRPTLYRREQEIRQEIERLGLPQRSE